VCIDAIPAFSSNSCSRPKFEQELSQKITTTQQKKQKTFISNLKKKKKKQNYKAANFFFFFFYCINKRKELQQITCQVPGCPRQTSA